MADYTYRMIDLQVFADSSDKTEKATPKKRQEARKKGQVLQSRELSSVANLLFLFLGVKIFGSGMYQGMKSFFIKVSTEYSEIDKMFEGQKFDKLVMDSTMTYIQLMIPIFAIAVLSALILGFGQVGFLFTVETLGFKFSRINPLSGLKRIFSLNGFVELFKATAKIILIGYISYSYLSGEAKNVLRLIDMDVISIGIYIADVSINVAIRICVALLILAVMDYGYQWWQYEKNLRMSKQEIKEEYKQTEGNPEIKSKIKQKQRQISMRRMLQDVPKADVVITNPTHIAVAIRYDTKVSTAPVVVAKGLDFIASRIREVAKENGIEIVENKPLARTLYDTVEVGQSIPPELYQAVAEVLAFVYSLKEKGRAG